MQARQGGVRPLCRRTAAAARRAVPQGRCLASFFALLLLAPALAQPQSVPDVYIGVEVLPRQTHLHDPILYRAHVTIQDGVTDSVSVVPPSFEGFTQLGEPAQESRPDASSTTEVLTYQLRPEQAGTLTIAPFTAQYKELDGRERLVRSATAQVVVDSGDTEVDIRPDRAPAELVDPTILFRRILLGLMLACAGVVVVVLLTHWLTRRAARPAPVAPAPPRVAAHYAALRRLKDLQAENLPARGLLDTYHIRLSGILRDYLAEQYGIASQESTSSETLLALFRRNVSQELLVQVKELLGRCDGVKFADEAPAAAQTDLLHQEAVDFVQRSALLTPGGDAAEPQPEEVT